MSSTDDGFRRSRLYDTFHANRITRVRIQAMEEVDGVSAGRDFSATKWQLRFRAYATTAATGQTFLVNEAMTKVVGTTAAGDTGKAEVNVEFAAADVGDVECEVVAIDTDVADTGTPSLKKEYRIDLPWQATVYASAGTT